MVLCLGLRWTWFWSWWKYGTRGAWRLGWVSLCMQLLAEAKASVLCFIVLSQYFPAPRTTKEMGLLHTVKTWVITSVGVVPERQVYWGAKEYWNFPHRPRHWGNSQSFLTRLHRFITWLLPFCSSEMDTYTRQTYNILQREVTELESSPTSPV